MYDCRANFVYGQVRKCYRVRVEWALKPQTRLTATQRRLPPNTLPSPYALTAVFGGERVGGSLPGDLSLNQRESKIQPAFGALPAGSC
jgi:hypothetical protein